jgi:hypothetical protein
MSYSRSFFHSYTDSLYKLVAYSISIIAVVIGGGIIAVGQQPETQNTPKGAVVRGRVFRSDTNQPAKNVLVALLDRDQIVVSSDNKGKGKDTQTDADGNFVIEGLQPGHYAFFIRVFYKQAELPCGKPANRELERNLLKRKHVLGYIVSTKDSYYEENIVSETFDVREGKIIIRNFDLACKKGQKVKYLSDRDL